MARLRACLLSIKLYHSIVARVRAAVDDISDKIDNQSQRFSLTTLLPVYSSLAIYTIIAASLIRFPLIAGTEPALYLTCAKALLQGQVPYVDFLVNDWPTTIATGLAPAMLGQVIPTSGLLLCNLCGLFAALISTLLCCGFLLPLRHHREWHSFPYLIVAMSAVNTVLLYQIGQPQYFAFFAITPYIIVRWLRQQELGPNRLASIFTGVLAALALTLDPLTIIAPILLETFWATRSRKLSVILSAETLTCILGFVACFAALAFFSNQTQVQNFSDIVQPTMAWNTQHIDVTTAERLAAPDRRDIVLPGCILAFVTLFLAHRCTLLTPFAIVFFSGLLVAVIEQQGLSRQYILMLGSGSMMAALTAAVSIEWVGNSNHLATSVTNLRQHIALLLILCVVAPASACAIGITAMQSRPTVEKWQLVEQTDGKQFNSLRDLIEAYSSAGDAILFLQKRAFPAFPLTVQMGRKQCNHFIDAGSIPSLADAPENTQREQSIKLCALLKDDISTKKPALIFIEEGTMQDALRNSGVLGLIDNEYAPIGSWLVVSENREPLEFFGNRLPLHAFARKTRLSPKPEAIQPNSK